MTVAVSLKPEDMSVGGGGILNDVNIRFDKVRFGMQDYKGKADVGSAVAMLVDYVDLDTGQEGQQGFTVGAGFTPSPDGKQLNAENENVKIKSSSNFGLFMSSLANAIGAEEFNANMTDDITILTGMECHVFQKTDERPTAKPKVGKDGKEYPATYPQVDKVMKKPWDANGTEAAAGASDDALNATATALILKVLAANPNGLNQQNLAVQVFNEAEADVKTAMVTLISNDGAFVAGIDGVTFENDLYKLG